AGAAVATWTGTFLAHLDSLERDLVGIERALGGLLIAGRHRTAAHRAFALATASEKLKVVAVDVEARLLEVLFVHVGPWAEAAVDEDLLALLDDLLRGL